MSGNPTLSPFSGWNEMHGGSMDRTPARKWANVGKLIAAHEFCSGSSVRKKNSDAAGRGKEFGTGAISFRNYSAPLGFCSLARREKRRIRSIWVICEDSSITATPLEGKRRGGAE